MNRSVFESLYQYWIWIGAPVMVVAVAALVWLILGIIATIKSAHLIRAPLSERQEVQFAEAGRVVLSMEGPHLTTRFARAKFDLRSVDGEPVEGHRAWFRARTSGFSTARVELLKFDIPRPGRYVLTVYGIGQAGEPAAGHAVVFMKPHLGRSLVYVVGIVLSSVTFIVSLVFFLLRLREP